MELQQAVQMVIDDASRANVPIREAGIHLQAAQMVTNFFNEYFENEQKQAPVPPKKPKTRK